MLRKISTWFNQGSDPQPTYRWCDHQGCQGEGIHKAPKRPEQNPNHRDPNHWYWFCKEHVREYNASWNYYKGMNEYEAQMSAYNDRHWNIPTWPIGQNPHQNIYMNPHTGYYCDPFNLFEAQGAYGESPLSPDQQEAIRTLQLPYPFSANQLQTSYRNLVKENHPDVHKTKDAEEKIRQINQAYQVLKNHAEW